MQEDISAIAELSNSITPGGPVGTVGVSSHYIEQEVYGVSAGTVLRWAMTRGELILYIINYEHRRWQNTGDFPASLNQQRLTKIAPMMCNQINRSQIWWIRCSMTFTKQNGFSFRTGVTSSYI
jgi:hypothetical protein